MFVCVFAKKFPALASQSCCEVSRPRAVGEYEYRLLGLIQTIASLCSLRPDLGRNADWLLDNNTRSDWLSETSEVKAQKSSRGCFRE